MSTTTQQIVEQLTDARAAYHDLMTGKAPRVVLDQNGEKIEFVAANSAKLYIYIQSLERQLTTETPAQSRGPAGFLF